MTPTHYHTIRHTYGIRYETTILWARLASISQPEMYITPMKTRIKDMING